ncbi:nuclear transport factor 2 family protein [Paenarthrobacter sp. PH39-S1]|uniref:nuclear transport factor 2 family protein n=1 Tax=Micrococcaceae TaxID=1268 RepID=UPI0024B8AC50|nr:nuclear transport factor 2 family protein [Paenarthrobacter sp. PH39-S1]MDJ0356873.1 nuclear transport factor 2 family protein [Paenarthrobacter sp. PH39-S1]
MNADAHPFLLTLQQATNAHDLDALVACFSPAYRNQTPAHPNRDFQGEQQVRANWQQIFAFVPDVHSRVLHWVANGPDVWSEWEMSGTRRDGTRHLMRGVIIFTLQHGQAMSARFYLEPVDENNGANADAAVRQQVHAATSS